MPTLTHRLQVLLDEERHQRLTRLAARHDTTVAELVRAALDRTYPSDRVTTAEAAERLLGREPIDELGTWRDAKRDIESGLGRGHSV